MPDYLRKYFLPHDRFNITNIAQKFALVFSLALGNMNCSQSMASIGDLSEWKYNIIKFNELPEEPRIIFLQVFDTAAEFERFAKHVYHAPDGELYMFRAMYRDGSRFCNTAKDCISVIIYERYSDGKHTVVKSWSSESNIRKPRLNHLGGRFRAINIPSILSDKHVLLTIYSEGEIEIQPY